MRWIGAIAIVAILGGCVTSPGFMNPPGKPTKIKVSHVKQDADTMTEDGTILRGGSETLTVEGSAGAGVDIAKSITFMKDVNTKTGDTHVEFAGQGKMKSDVQAAMVTDQSRLQAELVATITPMITKAVSDVTSRFIGGSSDGSGGDEIDTNPLPEPGGMAEILRLLPEGMSLEDAMTLLRQPGARVLMESLSNR